MLRHGPQHLARLAFGPQFQVGGYLVQQLGTVVEDGACSCNGLTPTRFDTSKLRSIAVSHLGQQLGQVVEDGACVLDRLLPCANGGTSVIPRIGHAATFPSVVLALALGVQHQGDRCGPSTSDTDRLWSP